MDYKTSWLIENEVVLMTPLGNLSIPDGVKMLQSASALIDQSPHEKVAVIADITKLTSSQRSVVEIFRMYKENRSPKWGFTVIIGEKDLKRIIAQAVLQTARVDVRFAKTINEALQVLYRVNPALADKIVNPTD